MILKTDIFRGGPSGTAWGRGGGGEGGGGGLGGRESGWQGKGHSNSTTPTHSPPPPSLTALTGGDSSTAGGCVHLSPHLNTHTVPGEGLQPAHRMRRDIGREFCRAHHQPTVLLGHRHIIKQDGLSCCNICWSAPCDREGGHTNCTHIHLRCGHRGNCRGNKRRVSS